MNKTNPYLKQLNTAIEATRNELLQELNQAQAARATALSARDYAASDQWTACKEMGLKEQDLAMASRIEEMAAHTELLARNLTLFANESQTDAAKAQSDMAEAAAAIKKAAGAMEVLTRGVHGAAAETKAKDAGDSVNDKAQAASEAVEKYMAAMDKLQTQSLSCSIIAATPLAGSVAQTFSVLGDHVGSLVAGTTKALSAARQEVAATTATRNQTSSRYYTQIPPFERQLQARNALLKSFAEIDRLANYGLKVSIANQPSQARSKSQQDQAGMVPGFLAEAVLPADAAGLYQTPVFYAVKELDAATFAFSSASKEVKAETKPAPKDAGKATDEAGHTADASAAPAPATDGSYRAHLQHDHKGEPIQFGETYRIFVKQELHHESPDASRMHGCRHSLPSQPITAAFTFEKNPSAPTLVRLRCGATDGPADPLLVAFTLPAAPAANVSHRMIIVPSKLWSSHLEDEQFLIERANPAAYAKLNFALLPDATNEGVEAIVNQITNRFAADLEVQLPFGDEDAAKKAAHQAVSDALAQLGTDALSRTVLVYYSPVFDSGQTSETAMYVCGDYLDMYGGLINLSNDSYRIGVLAWLDDPDMTTCVSALVGESKPIGVRTAHYYGPGPEDTVPAAPSFAPAA